MGDRIERFHRWFDTLPSGDRFLYFIATMAAVLLLPIVVWVALFSTPLRFDSMWINVADVVIMMPIAISRIRYIHKWGRYGRQR